MASTAGHICVNCLSTSAETPSSTSETGSDVVGKLRLARGGTLYLEGVDHLPLAWQRDLAGTLSALGGGRQSGADGGASRPAPAGTSHLPVDAGLAAGDRTFDGRSDIYALGCVAFWLLTGGLPFEGEDAVVLLMHHSRTLPSAPSIFSEEPIPPELDAVVLACLSKEPAGRPATVDVLWERFDGIQIARKWDQRRARSWWQDHEPDLIGQVSSV